MKKIATFLVLSIFLATQGLGQVYTLDFTGEEGKGLTSSNGGWALPNLTGVDWTIEYFQTATPVLPGSYFKVIDLGGNEVFAASGFSGSARWLGNNIPNGGINIAGLGNVKASVDLTEIGNFDPGDLVRVTYRLDGAADVVFDINGEFATDFTNVTASQSGLNGSTLRVFVHVEGDGDADIIYFDNILVEQVCTPPTTAASGLMVTRSGTNSLQVDFTSGNGDNRVVVVREGGPITKFPIDGETYSADADFSGSPQPTIPGGDEFVVYNGSGSSVEVTGLNEYKTYYVAVFEYNSNGPGSTPCYLTLNPAESIGITGCPELGNDVVFINELNYEPGNSANTNQGFEVAGPAGTILSNYTVYFYNKNGGYLGSAVPLSGTIPNQQNGYGVAYFNASPMIQSTHSAIALYNNVTMEVVEFISYQKGAGTAPVITATIGVAAGEDSTPLPVNKSASDKDTESIQRTGEGPCPSGMTWTGPATATPGQPNNGQVLPIELAFFKATLKKNNVVLEWQTLTENKNDFMAVERSPDAVSFFEIGRVAGAGDSYEPINYSHIDHEPLPGINYYRIRQVDFDGQYSYTKIVSVLNGEPTGELAVFPSVTSSALQVQFGAALRARGELRIFDLNGRLLYREPVDVGAEATTLDLPGWAPGTYLLQLQDGRDLRSVRFVKVD